jgi:hypothetical protein
MRTRIVVGSALDETRDQLQTLRVASATITPATIASTAITAAAPPA